MMDLCSPRTIAYIKDKYGFRTSRSLGQNFLTDRSIVTAIADATGACEDDLVIEIGPGIGTLTAELAERAGMVVAIELDKGLKPVLDETLAGLDNTEIVWGDVLQTDIDALADSHPQYRRLKIVGNLPYYITTPIIMRLLEENIRAESITAMMQKEVADRICAAPGSRDIGAISIAVQYYCDVESVTNVPRGAFTPPPKVESKVIKLIPGSEPAVNVLNEDVFFQCVKNGYGQRRKTLLNSLTGTNGADKDAIRTALESCGIDPARRAETLSIDEFGRIADALVSENRR